MRQTDLWRKLVNTHSWMLDQRYNNISRQSWQMLLRLLLTIGSQQQVFEQERIAYCSSCVYLDWWISGKLSLLSPALERRQLDSDCFGSGDFVWKVTRAKYTRCDRVREGSLKWFQWDTRLPLNCHLLSHLYLLILHQAIDCARLIVRYLQL